MDNQRKRTPILLLPFVIVWSLFSFFMRLTGRVVAGISGFIFMIIGIGLSVTLVAAPVGIPLAVFGFLLMLRSVF
ncbi:MAG: hypothetical protein WBW71_00915 [Bacteroidota bacterium]